MSERTGYDLSNPQSVEDILDGWKPFDLSRDLSIPGRDGLPETAAYPPARDSGGSLGFLDNFSLAEPAGWRPGGPLAPDVETVLRRDRTGRQGPIELSGPGARSPATGPPRRSTSSPPASRELPGMGDILAGFRILRELGRGAFARVYLAEELHLGGRSVAIKVSRAEGDEPRILARLQHANIVPVHSVRDDPTTGLRVLCMPYFGGANLAQVLDTATVGAATERSGHSLVEALDRISLYEPNARGESQIPTAPRPRPAVADAGASSSTMIPAAGSARPGSHLSVGNGLSIGSGFRSLFGKIVRGGDGLAAGPLASPSHGDDPHQPARQFLRTATAVHAAAWIVARLAEGLDHAHSRGLFHRDLKPANILLAADGTPMLLDFNLAADSHPHPDEGQIGRAMLGGTLPYMAPEHLDAFSPRGHTAAEEVAERADIYALGLILFEILAGKHPFPSLELAPGTSAAEVIGSMIEARRHPPSLRARCPHVPWSLDALVGKCLEFDPALRYVRARDLAEDLRRFIDDRPMLFTPELSPRERLGKFTRRHRALCGSSSIATIAVVLILGLGAGVAAVHSGMRGLVARFERQAFERGFTEAQFLLNTASASDRHLDAGLVRASTLLDRLELADDRRDPGVDWFRSLTGPEQERLREQVVELTMLEARSRVLLASHRGSATERIPALRSAVARLDRAARMADRVPSALYSDRARYLEELGEKEPARRDRRLADSARPGSGHDWTLLATSLLAAGDPPAAEDAARRALRLDPTSFWSWFVMGHCHFVQDRFLEAAGDFSACAAIGSPFAWVHFNRGLALARAGRLESAHDAYDQALRLDPDFNEARVNRALVSLELDHLESALADLSMAIRLGRNDAGVLAARGEALARLGRADEARRQFDKLLVDDPDNTVVRVARGMTRIRTDPDGARDDFERVLERDPRQAAAHYGLALLIRGDDLPGARDHLDIAVGSDPNLIDAVQLRALVRARIGDPAALDDVDRLLKSPTARRYYNAACAVAIYAEKAHQPKQLAHAMELLTRAVELGFPAAGADQDPDLAPLRDLPAFRRLPIP